MTEAKFGTDGIRGVANQQLNIAVATGVAIGAARRVGGARWVVGRDTRVSSPMISQALTSGLMSQGADVYDLGVVPSAAVSYLCRLHQISGAMVTASHNPYQDNGIKLFGPDGAKLPDELERAIEDDMREGDHGYAERVGRFVDAFEMRDEYERWLTERAAGIDASGLRIAVDTANGAAYQVAPRVLAATGAQLTFIGNEPDGENINLDCGSTHPELLKKLVQDSGCDFGIAFDGDADRVMFMDNKGVAVDGDDILAIVAGHMHRSGGLPHGTVVATRWSNVGLGLALKEMGLNLHSCEIGDKAVAEALRTTGSTLGGESSGHIIFPELLPVGDGLLTAIETMRALTTSTSDLAALRAATITKSPDASKNVVVASPTRAVVDEVQDDVNALSTKLGERGRVLLRASGTEKVVRVKVEAPTDDALPHVLEEVIRLVKEADSRVGAGS